MKRGRSAGASATERYRRHISMQQASASSDLRGRFPRACPASSGTEDGLEDSLSYYAYTLIEAKKISSTNMLERLNREIRRRTRVVGIFPNEESYTRLVTMHLIEYSEEWSVKRGAYFSPNSIQLMLGQTDVV